MASVGDFLKSKLDRFKRLAGSGARGLIEQPREPIKVDFSRYNQTPRVQQAIQQSQPAIQQADDAFTTYKAVRRPARMITGVAPFELARNIAQGTARSGGTLGLTLAQRTGLTNKPGIDLNDSISRALFGRNAQNQYRLSGFEEASNIFTQEAPNYLPISEQTAGKIAPIAVAGSVLSDFTGTGSGKKSLLKLSTKPVRAATRTVEQLNIPRRIHPDDIGEMRDLVDLVFDKGFKPDANLRNQIELAGSRIAERYQLGRFKTLRGLANKFAKILDTGGEVPPSSRKTGAKYLKDKRGKFKGSRSTRFTDPLFQEARKYKSAEEFVASYKGSGTQYGQYNPSLRAGGTPGSKRLTELGVNPNKEITIYRGIDDTTGKLPRKIQDGDFVTTDFDSARAYAGSEKDVVSMKVKAKDLFVDDPDDFLTEPFYKGSEYIYSTKQAKTADLTKSQLTDIWNQARKRTDRHIPRTEEFFGGVAGFEQDEEGNISFNPETALLGIGGIAALNKGRRILKDGRIQLPSQVTRSGKITMSPQRYAELVKDKITDLPKVSQVFRNIPVTSKDINGVVLAGSRLGRALSKEYDSVHSLWVGLRDAAKTKGIKVGNAFRSIPNEQATDVIKYIENPNAQVSDQAKAAALDIKTEYDRLLQDAREAGVNIGEIDNYITHIWDKPLDEVAQIYATVKGQFPYAKSRVLPTYEEGIAMGLTPKYNHPSQIIAEYVQQLEKAKANIAFVNELKARGLIVDGISADIPHGYKPIAAQGFPDFGSLYAPPRVADTINRVFNTETETALGSLFKYTAKASGLAQDVLLSGGLPKTPVNFFTVAQGIKEITSLSPKRVIAYTNSLAQAFSGKLHQRFMTKNADQVVKMQQAGIPLSSGVEVRDMVSRGTLRDLFGESLGELWHKTMNEPTFGRLIPQMQVRFFNDVERAALRAGKSADEAVRVAAKATKNWYGIIDSGKAAKRSQLSQDIARTVFFAPKFRESMVNLWVNSVKALKNPLALENRTNIRFLVGVGMTYALYDTLNQHFNEGRPISENPKGKTDKLLIPLPDGTVLGIPMLPSIATVPRSILRAGQYFMEGDVAGGTKDLVRSNISALAKPLLEVASNENYFGEQIYDENDTPSQKLKKQILHVIDPVKGGYTHPYLKAAARAGWLPSYDVKAGKFGFHKDSRPTYQIISEAMEFPIRYYTNKSISGGFYYDAKAKALKDLTEDQRKIYTQVYDMGDSKLEGPEKWRKNMSDAQLLLNNPEILLAREKIEKESAEKNKQPYNPFWDLDYNQRRTALVIQSLPPGNEEKKALQSTNIDWLKPYWAASSAFYDELATKGVFQAKPADAEDYFRTPQEMRELQDQYFKLPSGTGQRSAFLDAHPELTDFWDEKREFENQKRALLGLPPLEDSFGGGFRFGKRKPKLNIGKIASAAKVPTIKSSKPKKLQVKRPNLSAAVKPIKRKKAAIAKLDTVEEFKRQLLSRRGT